MSENITLTFTKNMPSFSLELVAPSQLPIDMVEAIKGVSGNQASSFTWTQSTPLSVWTIPHNLSKFPTVNVCDTTGALVQADVSYIDSNIVQITHGSAFAGKAYLN